MLRVYIDGLFEKLMQRDLRGTETATLLESFDFTGRRVLELGCGDGRLTWSYLERASSAVAIDRSPSEIAKAKAQTPPSLDSRVEFMIGEIESIDLPPASFEVALLTYSL